MEVGKLPEALDVAGGWLLLLQLMTRQTGGFFCSCALFETESTSWGAKDSAAGSQNQWVHTAHPVNKFG